MGSGNVSPQTSPSEKALTPLKKWSIGGGPGGAPRGTPPGPRPARPPRAPLPESRESRFGHFGESADSRNLGFQEMSDLAKSAKHAKSGKAPISKVKYLEIKSIYSQTIIIVQWHHLDSKVIQNPKWDSKPPKPLKSGQKHQSEK